MKSGIKMALLMAMAGVMMPSMPYIPEPTEEDIRRQIRFAREKAKKKLLKQGYKEFTFGDVVIYALNEKNAQRKYRKYLTLIGKE